jgi:hypothetical protein
VQVYVVEYLRTNLRGQYLSTNLRGQIS